MYEEDLLIEQFFKGNLNKEEVKNFTQRLNTESDFRAKVEDYKIIYSGFEVLKEKELLKQVQQWETNIRKEESVATSDDTKPASVKIRRLRSLLAIAASILLLMGTGLSWFATNQYSNQNLAVDNYSPPFTGMLDANMGGAEAKEIPLKEGIEFYEKQLYQEAIRYFETISDTDDKYIQAQYFLGHCYFQLKNYQVAIDKFSVIENRNGSEYVENATWDKIIVMLAADYSKEAIEQAIAPILEDQKHIAFKKAQALKAKLDSGWRQLAW